MVVRSRLASVATPVASHLLHTFDDFCAVILIPVGFVDSNMIQLSGVIQTLIALLKGMIANSLGPRADID